MQIITTISDVKNLVDTWAAESLKTETHSHDENLERLSRAIVDNRPDDLRWGADWTQYLNGIDSLADYLDVLDGK